MKKLYWMSDECAAYNRTRLANPAPKTAYRFKRAPDGTGFALKQKNCAAEAILNAPGYTTAVYLPTGDIVRFTESSSDEHSASPYRDTIFVGELDPADLVILQHADGYAARYQIGTGGLEERELTIYQAKWLEDACAQARIPFPIIDGYQQAEAATG